MMNQFTTRRKFFLLIISLIVLIAWFGGCASNKGAAVKTKGTKRITGITTTVTTDSVVVTINGNQPLTYTCLLYTSPSPRDLN